MSVSSVGLGNVGSAAAAAPADPAEGSWRSHSVEDITQKAKEKSNDNDFCVAKVAMLIALLIAPPLLVGWAVGVAFSSATIGVLAGLVTAIIVYQNMRLTLEMWDQCLSKI